MHAQRLQVGDQRVHLGLALHGVGAAGDLRVGVGHPQGPLGREMLAEMIDLLAVEGPKQMAEIKAAYDAGDAEAVMRAAHTLKGSVSLFAAASATAAALRIEMLGRERNLQGFPQAWADLQNCVADLQSALDRVKS